MTDLIQIAALGIVNATRERHGLECITWDFRALSGEHKNRALDQAKGALDALLGAGYIVMPSALFDPEQMASKIAKCIHDQGFTLERLRAKEQCLRLAQLEGDCEVGAGRLAADPVLCPDCPPVGYPTDKTRCTACPRRSDGQKELRML